jgi:ATP-dependent helicase STH1/SNF2
VRVFRLVCQNSIEERILERASFKLDVDAKVIQAGMFNNFANDKMRRAMLEALLKDTDDEKELELLASDDQINMQIARFEDEYKFYTQLDEERNKREAEEWKLKQRDPPPR